MDINMPLDVIMEFVDCQRMSVGKRCIERAHVKHMCSFSTLLEEKTRARK